MDTPIGIIQSSGSFEIDKKTYKIDSNNYNATKSKKSQIVLGGSGRSGSNHLLRLKKKDFGLTKTWPTFTIRRDGKVFQHFDPNYYSEFMGSKETDKKVISVVLENMGMLSYDYDKNMYVNWANEECNENLVHEKLWKGNRYWEAYSEAQLLACVNLCVYLCRNYGIRQDCVGNHVSYEGASIFNGILTRGNYYQDAYDLSAVFDFKRFLKELSIFT